MGMGDRIHILRTPKAVWVISLVFYGGLTLLLVAIMTKTLDNVLPSGFATKIGYDSEGFFFALGLAAWLQLGIARLQGRRLWAWALGLGVLFAFLGLVMLNVPMPSAFKTLNEPCFALALVILYVALRRPLGAWPPMLSAALVVTVVMGVALWPDSLVINLAETTMTLILAPLAFDVFDRRILDPSSRERRILRRCWYAALIVLPVTVVALGVEERLGDGVLNQALHYLGRSQESFVGILLATAFISIVMGLNRTSPRGLQGLPPGSTGRLRTASIVAGTSASGPGIPRKSP